MTINLKCFKPFVSCYNSELQLSLNTNEVEKWSPSDVAMWLESVQPEMKEEAQRLQSELSLWWALHFTFVCSCNLMRNIFYIII